MRLASSLVTVTIMKYKSGGHKCFGFAEWTSTKNGYLGTILLEMIMSCDTIFHTVLQSPSVTGVLLSNLFLISSWGRL